MDESFSSVPESDISFKNLCWQLCINMGVLFRLNFGLFFSATKASDIFDNTALLCLTCNSLNKWMAFTFIIRLLKPVTESRVLESDAASAGLLTSIPPSQEQTWTSTWLQWCVQPCCHTLFFTVQKPNQPLPSAGNLMLLIQSNLWVQRKPSNGMMLGY